MARLAVHTPSNLQRWEEMEHGNGGWTWEKRRGRAWKKDGNTWWVQRKMEEEWTHGKQMHGAKDGRDGRPLHKWVERVNNGGIEDEVYMSCTWKVCNHCI